MMFVPDILKRTFFYFLFTLALSVMFLFFGFRISMHISYALALILLVIFAFSRPQTRPLNKDEKLLLWGITLYALSCLPPLLLNSGYEGSWRYQEAFLKFLLYGFILFLAFKMQVKIIRPILIYCIFIGGILTCICGIYVNLIHHSGQMYLYNGIFQFAYFLAVISLISLNLLLSQTTRRIKYLAFITLTLCLLCLLVNASRGIILGFSFGCLATFLIHLAHQNLTTIIKKSYLPFLIAAACFTATPSFHFHLDKKTKQVEQETLNFKATTDNKTSIGLRFKIWDNAIAMWKLSPIFGMNVKTRLEKKDEITAASHFKIPIPDNSHLGESHNETANALAKNGIVGLLALWFLYFVSANLFITKLRTPNYIWPCMGISVLILYITDGCFNTPLDSKIEAPLFCLCILIFHILYSQSRSKYHP